MKVVLVKAVHTSFACPSQWDAWDADGQYYYLRYRHGHGTMNRYDNPEWSYDDITDPELLALRTAADAAKPSVDRDAFEAAWDAYWARFKTLYQVASFAFGDELDGVISLGAFCEKAGVGLSPDLEEVSYGEYFKAELRKAFDEL